VASVIPGADPHDSPAGDAAAAPLPRGRHGLSREEVETSQRSRILDAMIAAVDADGYVEATLTDVTGRARVSRKTFYEHFEDKEACFIAAFDDLFADLLAVARSAYDAPGEWPDRLGAALATVLSTLQDDRLVARICFVESLTAGPRAARVRNTAMGHFDLRQLLPDLLYPALTMRLGPEDARRTAERLLARV
jgi:AcrR family transcriptional regulator